MIRWLAAPVVLVMLVGCTPAGGTPSTYTLADGRVYQSTDCPAANDLLIGGYDAADGLPMKGQTDRARVEEMVEDIRKQFAGSTDVIAINVVPRNGEVWYRLDDGDYAVELAEDFQYEFVLSADGACPSSAYNINGVPVFYTRADG